jgi:hypothetical protein
VFIIFFVPSDVCLSLCIYIVVASTPLRSEPLAAGNTGKATSSSSAAVPDQRKNNFIDSGGKPGAAADTRVFSPPPTDASPQVPSPKANKKLFPVVSESSLTTAGKTVGSQPSANAQKGEKRMIYIYIYILVATMSSFVCLFVSVLVFVRFSCIFLFFFVCMTCVPSCARRPG